MSITSKLRSLSAIVLWLFLQSSDAAGLADLAHAIESLRQEHGIAAVGYFVVTREEVLDLKAFGKMRWDGPTYGANDLIRVGSITKAVTALATMRLVEEHKLDLTRPLSDLIDVPLHNPWWPQQPVRLAHLLEHTAGLRDLSKKEFDHNVPLALEKAFAIDPASRQLQWPPGRHSSYSNTGAGIASYLIEKTTGKRFERFVDEEIFKPLGMSSAQLESVADHPRLVTGYNTDGTTTIPYWHTLYRAFGGMSVSLHDMVPFVQVLLGRGELKGQKIFSLASIKRMERPHTTLAARNGLTYGYGLGIYQRQRCGVSFFGHGGDADGYLAHFAYAPDLDRGYFVVINAFKQNALIAMRKAIESHLLSAAVAPAIEPPTITLDAEDIRMLVGNYTEVTQRFAGAPPTNMEVLVENGDLYSRHDAKRKKLLLPVSRRHFRRAGQSSATLAFILCTNRVYLQGDFGNFAKPRERIATVASPSGDLEFCEEGRSD